MKVGFFKGCCISLHWFTGAGEPQPTPNPACPKDDCFVSNPSSFPLGCTTHNNDCACVFVRVSIRLNGITLCPGHTQ